MIRNRPEGLLQEHPQVIVDIILHLAKSTLIRKGMETAIMNVMEAAQEALPPPRNIKNKKV